MDFDACDAAELAEWQAMQADWHVAIVFEKGQYTDFSGGGLSGAPLRKTTQNMIKSVLGDKAAGMQGFETREVPGRANGLEFVTVTMKPEDASAFFGAADFIRKEATFVFDRGVLGKMEQRTATFIVCRVDRWPPEVVGGEHALFDPSIGAGGASPGLPAAIFIDDKKRVRIDAKLPCRIAARELLKDVDARLRAQGLVTRMIGEPIPIGATEHAGPTAVKVKLWVVPLGGGVATTPAEYAGILLPRLARWPADVTMPTPQAKGGVVYETHRDKAPDPSNPSAVRIKWDLPTATATLVTAPDGEVGFRVGGANDTDMRRGRAGVV